MSTDHQSIPPRDRFEQLDQAIANARIAKVGAADAIEAAAETRGDAISADHAATAQAFATLAVADELEAIRHLLALRLPAGVDEADDGDAGRAFGEGRPEEAYGFGGAG